MRFCSTRKQQASYPKNICSTKKWQLSHWQHQASYTKHFCRTKNWQLSDWRHQDSQSKIFCSTRKQQMSNMFKLYKQHRRPDWLTDSLRFNPHTYTSQSKDKLGPKIEDIVNKGKAEK